MLRITALLAVLTAFSGNVRAQEWETISFPSPEPITGIVMFNSDTGYVVTGDGNFVRTPDRGKSWYRAEDVSGARLEALCFLDQNTGWICGHKGKIYSTSDGGHNWVTQFFKDTMAIFFDIQMVNKDTGIVVGMRPDSSNSLNSIALQTTDGGKTWKQLEPMGLAYSDAGYEKSNKLLYFMSIGRMNYSTDCGRKWKSTGTLEGPPARTISFFGNTGILAGPKGVCGYTVDGGKVWYKSQRPETEHFFSSALLDSKRGFIGGLGGTMFYTADGGRNWQPEKLPKLISILDLFALNNTIYAVGSEGTILCKTLK